MKKDKNSSYFVPKEDENCRIPQYTIHPNARKANTDANKEVVKVKSKKRSD